MFILYVIDLSNNTDGWENKKIFFFAVFSFKKFLIFPIWVNENGQRFVGAFL